MHTKIFLFLVVAVFSVHSVVNLEKHIYINEVFSAVGLLYFFYAKFYKIQRSVYDPLFWLTIFIAYCLCLVSVSILLSFNDWVSYGRTLVLFYSIFVFFLGFWVGKSLTVAPKLFFLTTPFAFIPSERMLLSTALLGLKSRTAIFFSLVACLYAYLFIGTSTPLVSASLILIFLLFRRYHSILNSKKILVFVVSAAIVIPFLYAIYFHSSFAGFVAQGYGYFGPQVDANSYWRLMYWQHLISETLRQSPIFGFGFGSKLFDHSDVALSWLVVTEYSKENPLIEYVLGPHNSIVTIFYRTGTIGLVLFLGFLVSLFRLVLKSKNYSLLCALCVANATMLFNVVLESPVWSVNYWFVTGYVYVLCRQFLLQVPVSR